VPMNLL